MQWPQENSRSSPPEEPVVVRCGPLSPPQVDPLCQQVARLLREGRPVVVDLSRVGRPDLAVVDALARMHREARRLGSRIYVREAGPELECLLELTGLRDAVPLRGLPSGDHGGSPEGFAAGQSPSG